MIQKSVLVELIKEVLAENPEITQGKVNSCCGSRTNTAEPIGGRTGTSTGNQSGQFGALEQLARLAMQQGKEEVAKYIYLAIEADTLPGGIMDKIKLAEVPFEMTKQELDSLAHQLSSNWQAPEHAKLVQGIIKKFADKHCLKRSYDY